MDVFVTVTGRDHPGVTAGLFEVLERAGARLIDLEQVVVLDQLLLGILVSHDGDPAALAAALSARSVELRVHTEVRPLPARRRAPLDTRQHVTVLADTITAATMGGLATALADSGANIERIAQLATYPLDCYELVVSTNEPARLRRAMAAAAGRLAVDVAVQPAGLHRRAKRLLVLDVDSTLIRDEVIDLLAERAGLADAVAKVTQRAMAGELDFATSLRERVALLAGLDAGALDDVRRAVRLTRGARTLVRTLHRLGCAVGVVSGGFSAVIEPIAAELGLDYVAANSIEVVDGHLTGRVLEPIVDRAGKAEALVRFAGEAGVPLEQTVAVGDGANDLDMLATAGLGIAFNAKPLVREAADAALSAPYLDAILFLLGISREEVEAADARR